MRGVVEGARAGVTPGRLGGRALPCARRRQAGLLSFDRAHFQAAPSHKWPQADRSFGKRGQCYSDIIARTYCTVRKKSVIVIEGCRPAL